MRTREILGLLILMGLTLPASAQFSAMTSSKTKGAGSSSGIPSVFTSPLGKQNFTSISTKQNVPAPLNLGSMMPRFSNLQDTLRLRNIFIGPQVVVNTPKQQVPPPPKKKVALLP